MNRGYQYPYYNDSDNCDAFIPPNSAFTSFNFTPFSTPSATPSEMIDNMDSYSPSAPSVYRYNDTDFTFNELLNYYTKYLIETNDYIPPDLYLQIERGLCPTWPNCDLQASNCWYFHPDQSIIALEYYNAHNDKKPDERFSKISSKVFEMKQSSHKPLSFPLFSPLKSVEKPAQMPIESNHVIEQVVTPPKIDDAELLRARIKKKRAPRKTQTPISFIKTPPINPDVEYAHLSAEILPGTLQDQISKYEARQRISRHFSTAKRPPRLSFSQLSHDTDADLFIERPKNYQSRHILYLLNRGDNTIKGSYFDDLMVPISAKTYENLYLEEFEFDDNYDELNENAKLFVPSSVLSGFFDTYSPPNFAKSSIMVRSVRKIDQFITQIQSSMISRILIALFDLSSLVTSHFYSILASFLIFIFVQIYSAFKLAAKYPVTMLLPFIGAYFFPFLCCFGIDDENLSHKVSHYMQPAKTARHIAIPFAHLFGFILDKNEQKILFERTSSPLIIYTAIGPRATTIILTLISCFLFWRLPPFLAPILDHRNNSWPSFLTPHLKSSKKLANPRVSTTTIILIILIPLFATLPATMILFLTVPPTVRITLIYWLAEHIKSQRLEPTSTFNSTIVPLTHSLIVLFVALIAPRSLLNVFLVYVLSVNILSEKLNIVPSSKIFMKK